MCTVISMSAVAGVVFDLADPRNRVEAVFNSDVTSLLLGVDKQAVYAAEDTVDELAAERKGVCRTVDDAQQRGISLMATISGDGSLVSLIAILKDRNIKSASALPRAWRASSSSWSCSSSSPPAARRCVAVRHGVEEGRPAALR